MFKAWGDVMGCLNLLVILIEATEITLLHPRGS